MACDQGVYTVPEFRSFSTATLFARRVKPGPKRRLRGKVHTTGTLAGLPAAGAVANWTMSTNAWQTMDR